METSQNSYHRVRDRGKQPRGAVQINGPTNKLSNQANDVCGNIIIGDVPSSQPLLYLKVTLVYVM